MNDKQTEKAPQLLGRVLGTCATRLWGLSSTERYERAFARNGIGLAESDTDSAVSILVRADYVLAESLIKALANKPGTILVSNATKNPQVLAVHAAPSCIEQAQAVMSQGLDALPTENAFTVLTTVELGSNYNSALRKIAEPLALSLIDTPKNEIEKKMFADVYKGATDLVTKWCWPWPARYATRWAADLGISPNSITTASLVMVLLATWLFWIGEFAWGIPIAWFMTFLDTVDGKLARVTLTSSYWGNLYDHGIDLIHPPFWWWAWYHAVAVAAGGTPAAIVTISFWIIIVGYLVGRIMEGIFLHGFKIQTHVWRPVDYWFRTITARRNPNLVILMVFAMFGEPALGLVAVAAWTIASLLFHAVRLLQAFLFSVRGGKVESWMTAKL